MDQIIKKTAAYLEELYRWNEKINLTSVEMEDANKVLVMPSLEMVKHFPAESGLKVFDIGSGGGIPAIVLALSMPGNTFFAIESVKKKYNFLVHIVTFLGMENLLPINERTEVVEEKLEFFEAGDVITSRQVDPATVFQSANHLLKHDGRIILHRSQNESYDHNDFKVIKTTENVISLAWK